MISALQNRTRAPACAPRRRRPKGWTQERRARQALAIRTWQPWRHATGPRTEAGKARCVMNALRHGFRRREHIETARLARHTLRVAARNIAIIRTHLRLLRQQRKEEKLVPQDRIELSTYPLPRGCATTTLLRHVHGVSPRDRCYNPWPVHAKGRDLEEGRGKDREAGGGAQGQSEAPQGSGSGAWRGRGGADFGAGARHRTSGGARRSAAEGSQCRQESQVGIPPE